MTVSFLHARSRLLLFGPCLSAAFLVGCMSADVSVSSGDRQPRLSSYVCDGGGRLVVTNLGTSVTVTAPGADVVVLPASPPGQRNRYSEELHTLVFNGREAFWHKTGDIPRDCRR